MERFLFLLTILSLAVLAIDFEEPDTSEILLSAPKRAKRGKNSIHELTANRSTLHDECQSSMQDQIDTELHASLTYMNMAAHFQRLDVGRKGFAKFFHDSSNEEKEHAEKLIKYITRRGGVVGAFKVPMPHKLNINDGQGALHAALALEEKVNNLLHELHETAESVCKDPHLMDFLESEFLEEQVESISELKRYITVLSKMPNGMGEYLLDKELAGEKIEL